MDELVDRISEMVGQIRKEFSYVLSHVNLQIEDIITKESKDAEQIEHILDQLLDYIPFGYGEEEFRNLNWYYSRINKECSDDYDKFLREILEESE